MTQQRLLSSVLLLFCLSPCLGLAEGAVQFFNCTITQHCDAAGLCKASSESVTFRLEPTALRSDGAGQYTLSYGANKTTMETQSSHGPFFWTIGDEHNTLLASSETQFLWHQFTIRPTPTASIHFLTCEFKS